MASSSTHITPVPEVGSWNLLVPLPGEEDERIEVGVVIVHPAINRVAYTTRARNDNSEDVGRCRIIIQDFDDVRNETVASISLRELVERINEFRNNTNSHLSTFEAHQYGTHHRLHSLSAKPPHNMSYTAQMLGAVQNLAFLSRDAIYTQVPPGYVREEPSTMQRLMIGFRRCVAIVSIFHLEDQHEESCARGIEVIGYIGPDDLDEHEQNEKTRKRQASSFPIPISENIIAYGCYDGGIRFYDMVTRTQVKSALGPNGRGNPIVRLINANRNESKYVTSPDNKNRKKTKRQRRPRIVSVAPSGVAAYLWELDLSIDLDNGEILQFHIPPPLVCFDGLVAAVSCKGLPVKYPPTLSPTSIASLSPWSSWEQTDEVNSQFEVSYDPHKNVLCWVFSPDCVGSSLKPRGSREERLNTNGVLVVWDLGDMPQPEFPPPMLPPHCVQQLPRTEGGRVTADMAVPIILSDPYVVTIYITSSNELMATVSNLNECGESIHLESRVSELADLSGYSCCTVAATSRFHSPVILIGTQYGILFATVSSGGESVNHCPPCSSLLSVTEGANEIISSPQRKIIGGKVTELEGCNTERVIQLRDIEGVQSWSCGESETEMDTVSSKVEALEAEVEMLQDDLCRRNAELDDERLNSLAIMVKLAAIESRADDLEELADSRKYELVAMQEECNTLRNQLDEIKENTPPSNLQEELANAKEFEGSLRSYITLLEETLSAGETDLEVARQQAEEYKKRHDEMAAVAVERQLEQQLAIESLVGLLDRERIDHATEKTRLGEELSTLQTMHHASTAEMKLKAESSTEIILAMTVELQNTRNELDVYRHKHRSQGLKY